jgi:hypothetical protein
VSGAVVRAELPQQYRLLAALGYFVVLLCLARYLNGTFWPPYGLTGLWFYSAAAALLLGEFLLEPFFTRPADAIASSVAIVIAAATVSLADAEVSQHAAHVGRIVVIACAGALTATAILAVVFKDSPGRAGALAEASTFVVARLGRARWLFSGLLFAAGYAAFADSSGRVAALYLTWFAIIVLAPLEAVLALELGRRSNRPARLGVVEALDDPATVVARLPRGATARLGDEVAIDTGARGSVVEVTTLTDEPRVRVALTAATPVRVGSKVELTGTRAEAPVVGHVTDGTSIEEAVIATVPLAAEIGLGGKARRGGHWRDANALPDRRRGALWPHRR